MTAFISHLAALTAGDALKTSWEFLLKGGWFMVPLGITSIAGMIAILYKSLSLSRRRVIPAGLASDVEDIEELAAAGKADRVIEEFRRGDSALARLASVAVKHRGKPRGEITHAVESAAREEVVHLHSGIAVLDTVITVAPLLGLLGTASGLVRIFQGLGDNSDHLAIARGIAEALTTTIVGLAIAVPCIVAHGHFVRKIEMLTMKLESLLAHLAHVFEGPESKS